LLIPPLKLSIGAESEDHYFYPVSDCLCGRGSRSLYEKIKSFLAFLKCKNIGRLFIWAMG
jgi:hypothetical protein